MLYLIVKYLGRFSLPIYFGELTVLGRDNLPHGQPMIIAPNHQNAFLDAIIIGSIMDVDVHFLTRSDVFVKPYIAILRALHMMPVYRMRDGYENLGKNEEIFNRCEKILAQNEAVLIFPEGNMAPGYHLRSLTKGTARLAAQAQDNIPQDVWIVPTGINYFHHEAPRHRVVLSFGKAIRVRDFEEKIAIHKNKGLTSLTKTLADELSCQMLLADKDNATEQNLALLRNASRKHSWSALKQLLNSSNSLDKKSTLSAWWVPILSIPNLPVVVLIHYFTQRLIGTQFLASVRFILSLFFYPIYWLFVGIASAFVLSWPWVIVVLLICIMSLLAKGEYKRRLTIWT